MQRMGNTPADRAFAAAIVSAVLLAGCSGTTRPPTTIEARVAVSPAAPGTVHPRVSLGGIIVPFQNVAIQSNLSEPTDAVYVNEGDRVHAGEVLARLDTADLEANLRSLIETAASDHAKSQQTYLQAGLTIVQNSNSVDAAQAALSAAQTSLAKDSLDLQRDTQLLAQGYISQQAYDTEKALVTTDQQSVRSAQVALQNQIKQVQVNGTTATGLQGATVAAAIADEKTALAQADQVRASIARATIVSPIDGIVVNRNLNPGEYPGSRQIFTIQQMDKVYAMLNGSGGQIVGIRKGSPAQVTATDRQTVTATGTVSAVLDEVTPGSTNFVVQVVMDNPRGAFHSGMVVAGVVSRPPTSGIRVPQTAFVDDTQSTVQIVQDGAIKTVPVTMVAEDGKYAVVQGLPRGDLVVVNGQLGLADGQQVQPVTQVAER